jgi:hypothetical protein
MEQTTPVTVRVQWHANGGFTRVEDAQGRHWEIPTQAVPADLRQIGDIFTALQQSELQVFIGFNDVVTGS